MNSIWGRFAFNSSAFFPPPRHTTKKMAEEREGNALGPLSGIDLQLCVSLSQLPTQQRKTPPPPILRGPVRTLRGRMQRRAWRRPWRRRRRPAAGRSPPASPGGPGSLAGPHKSEGKKRKVGDATGKKQKPFKQNGSEISFKKATKQIS